MSAAHDKVCRSALPDYDDSVGKATGTSSVPLVVTNGREREDFCESSEHA
jgi:hypothetical protein